MRILKNTVYSLALTTICAVASSHSIAQTPAVTPGAQTVPPTQAAASTQEPMFMLCTPPDKVAIVLNEKISEKGLFSTLGKNVKPDKIDIGEGETLPGTVLFPTVDNKRVYIIWKDPKTRLKPATLEIEGPVTLWRTNFGVQIGMTLQQVEKLNGRPFKLAGFDWDYGGRSTSFNGGALQRKLSRKNATVTLQFAYRETDQVPTQVLGDSDFSSSHPQMHKLNPIVQAIYINYN